MIATKPHERAVAFYDLHRDRSHAFLYGQDPGVASLSQLGWLLWHLGFPDRALEQTQAAIALARHLAHPFSLTGALFCTAVVSHLRREPDATKEQAEEAIALADRHGFPFFLTSPGVGANATGTGGTGAGRDAARHRRIPRPGGEIVQPAYAAALADAYGRVGRGEEGLGLLAGVKRTGERRWESELLRVSSELRAIAQKDKAEAERLLFRAREVANCQGSKSFELRAAVSLGRLLCGQGRAEEGRKLLTDTFSGFT